MVAQPSGPRSASRPCWRPACSSGTSSSRFRPMRPRSRSSASNGNGAFGCPARTAGLGFRCAHFVDSDNPLGLNPDDPNGQDDIVVIDSDDLHLPVGKPVKVLLRSIDVVHDFYVPEFRAKMDLMPGSSPISGSRRPEPAHSRFSAPDSAVSDIRRCGATSWSRKRTIITRGCRSSRRSRSFRGSATSRKRPISQKRMKMPRRRSHRS